MFHNETKGIVTKVIDLKCNLKNSHYNRNAPDSSFTFGGIFSDFELAWLYNGPILKIVNVADGVILSSLDFSNVTHDSRTLITNVIEYPICDNSQIPVKENQICIIVSYSSKRDANKGSYISFCHPRTSRILHTITTREKVTCLSLIATRKDHACPIGGLVKLMSGALAVGTKNGNLLILDIKDMFSCVRRNSFDPSQTRFSEMLVLDTKRYNENEIRDKLCKLDTDAYHIAIALSDKKESRDSDQEICAITYISQGTTLAVGLKSGVFQLWDVNTLKKLYKSSPLPVPTPVVRFGFHEPCNDPQNFCYLWVLHESDNKEQTCLPFAVMYGVLYKRVSTIPSYGRHYKNFVHCKKRFDLDVDLEQCINGRCITSSVVSNTPSNILRHVTVNEEDPSKINLFVMIFETWERDDDLTSCISLVVFDMNQWYKAQMPHQCYPGFSVPFVNFMLLERVSERKSSILDMQIKKDTIQQFLTFNLSEEYSYPSSLSFDTIFLSDSKIVYLRVPGAQRCVLENIVSDGPSGLINPSKYYTECKEAGLRPCFSETYSNVIIPSQIQQRNYVLTILLENKMSSFLVRCVKEWADGSRGVSGCTLPNLIQWAWDCITRIKQSTDTICIPLFDYSGDDLDRENYQKLKHCCQLIHVIRDLFAYIYKNYKLYLLDDTKLKQQVDTLQLVTKYFDVIIWCLDCGLLPEKVSSSTDKCVPTYMLNVIQYTEQRRQELKNIAMRDKYFLIEESTLYLIDSVLENEPKGKKLQLQWERESGGISGGLYPPVTLQSLLRIFLMPDLPIDLKHFIMLYFLLDVCDYHRDEDMKEQLFSFSVVFSIDKPYFSLIQACWFFDHEKFEDAADILLIDSVTAQLQNNQKLYKTMLQACVCQKQYALALKFERFIKLSSFVFSDERFYITLLLQNGLVMEAYTSLKKICFGQKILLQHFFKVCDDLGLLKEIFKFPITPEEEEEFMEYLDQCKNRDAGDLKVMYLLSRARYVEAVDVNHNFSTLLPKFSIVGNDTTKQNSNKGRTTTRDLLVNAFSRTLPSVTNELITFCRKEKDKIYRRKEVAKPMPLSVVVHADTSQQIPTYKSSFESVLHAAISKTAETWTRFPKMSDRIKENDSIIKDTPFLRSDIMTPRKDKSTLLFNREKMNFGQEKSDADEPPSKRLRRSSINANFENYSEMNCSESLISPSVEVTKILRTPHVQKRLNRLLENTPESSPLTSILKSSEISRFKQPQKVGFSVPEVKRKTPRRVADAQTNTPSKSDNTFDDSSLKKSLVTVFDKSPGTRADNSAKNEASVQNDVASPLLDDSLNNSNAAESYYSLESDNESLTPGMVDFGISETGTPVTKHFIESMSDEDVIKPRKHVVMEVMSEGEIAEENISAGIVVTQPSEEQKEHVILQEQQPASQGESFIMPEQDIIPKDDLISISQQQLNILLPEQNIASQDRQYLENTYLSRRVDDKKEMYSLDNAEEVNPFFNENFEEVCDKVKPSENVSFVPLQPMSVPLNELKNESPVKNQYSIYDEYNEEPNEYSSQFLEKDHQFDENDEPRDGCLEITQPTTLREDFSLETYEKEETINETADTAYESNAALDQSVTEIKDTSSEEDSDIEIVEECTTLSAAATVGDQMNDATTEENDDMSEKTYESDYSYSQESVDGESYIEDNESIVNEDQVVEELEGLEDEYEDEDDLEEDEVEAEAEETEAEEENEIEEEEAEAEEEADEKAFEGMETEKEKSGQYDQESVYQNNLLINYDELRQIVSDVKAAEAKANEANVQESETRSENRELMSISSSGFSETEASVCEIYNMTQSIIEETVPMEYSDSSKVEVDLVNETVSDLQTKIFSVESDDDKQSEKSFAGNESRKENTSVEILSLSSVEPSKSSEGPPMVFYFGENSVTSIAEELLNDEPQEHNVSKQEGDAAQSSIEDSRSATVEKWEPIDEDQESFRENDESSSSGNVASEKHEGFEVEESGCLTATQPECNIHYIEKIDIEDSRQYERFGNDQYCDAEEANQNQEEKDAVHKPDETEGASSIQLFRYQSVIVAGEEERPQDLSQYDEAAREAREASRFADGTSRDNSGIVSAEEFYKVDSISKDKEPSKSVFLSQPDTSPLDLAMATDVSALPPAITSPGNAENMIVVETPVEVSSLEKKIVADNVPEPIISLSETNPIIQPLQSVVPDVNSPRRSLRIARRLSIDSIPDAVDHDTSVKPCASPRQPSRRRSLVREFESEKDNIDDDDVMSIKSGSSIADSIASRVSNASSRLRKRSFSRLEMRKSSAKRSFKTLEIIVSDEEEASSTKSDLISSHPRTRMSRKYAASEPGDQPTYTRTSKRSRTESEYSDEEKLSTTSDLGAKKSKSVSRKRSDSKMLNEAILETPSPVKSRMKKLVSSTPMALNLGENEELKLSVASKDYTSSRRLTRFQKTLLECGIRRVERSEGTTSEPHRLQNIPEENNSFDSEQDCPEGSLLINADETETESVAHPAVKSRLTEKKVKKSAKQSGSAEPTPPAISKPISPEDVSSDESYRSKASASSRRSKSRPSTYSSMELRRSSARRNFKPLAVIPSDDESSSFQTPQKVSRLAAEYEIALSSPENSPSKPRRATRSKKNESDVSDRESSSVSDISSISSSVTTRRTRRSLAGDMSSQTGKEKQLSEPPSSPSKQYASNRRLTRTQKSMMEKQSLLEKSKKK